MDPIAASALISLASSAARVVGRDVWAGLTALVRRFTATDGAAGDDVSGTGELPTGSGEAEVARLSVAADDEEAAAALAEILAARAAANPEFGRELAAWWSGARQLVVTGGDVHNSVTGTVSGPVIQGRDFSGPISFGS
jgi:hypothetical protein